MQVTLASHDIPTQVFIIQILAEILYFSLTPVYYKNENTKPIFLFFWPLSLQSIQIQILS